MPMITQTTEVTINLTPAKMAKAFWDMDANEQAEFFEKLDSEVAMSELLGDNLIDLGPRQWDAMARYLKYAGKKVLQQMAEAIGG